ncbi:MAG: hypothetical protein CMH26_08670 [Micavibrio sp.]|nr:hypothetical protein [Micavibrio sp.]
MALPKSSVSGSFHPFLSPAIAAITHKRKCANLGAHFLHFFAQKGHKYKQKQGLKFLDFMNFYFLGFFA